MKTWSKKEKKGKPTLPAREPQVDPRGSRTVGEGLESPLRWAYYAKLGALGYGGPH